MSRSHELNAERPTLEGVRSHPIPSGAKALSNAITVGSIMFGDRRWASVCVVAFLGFWLLGLTCRQSWHQSKTRKLLARISQHMGSLDTQLDHLGTKTGVGTEVDVSTPFRSLDEKLTQLDAPLQCIDAKCCIWTEKPKSSAPSSSRWTRIAAWSNWSALCKQH